jgi:cell division protein FtsN
VAAGQGLNPNVVAILVGVVILSAIVAGCFVFVASINKKEPLVQQQAPQVAVNPPPPQDLTLLLDVAAERAAEKMFQRQNAPTMQVQFHDRQYQDRQYNDRQYIDSQGTQTHQQRVSVRGDAVASYNQGSAQQEFQPYVNKETPGEDNEEEQVVTPKKSKADKKKTQKKSKANKKDVKTEQWTIGWNFSGLCWFLGFVIIVLVASQPVWVWLRRLLF